MNLGILVALICPLFAVVRAQEAANGDCYNSLSCSGGRICFQGKCESPPNCQDPKNDCKGPGIYVCKHGFCHERYGIPGARCRNDEGCDSLKCNDGLCSKLKADNEKCKENKNCKSGFCTKAFVCKVRGGKGGYCDIDYDCPKKYLCYKNTCEKSRLGRKCEDNDDCKDEHVGTLGFFELICENDICELGKNIKCGKNENCPPGYDCGEILCHEDSE